jgi:hypothetical protein
MPTCGASKNRTGSALSIDKPPEVIVVGVDGSEESKETQRFVRDEVVTIRRTPTRVTTGTDALIPGLRPAGELPRPRERRRLPRDLLRFGGLRRGSIEAARPRSPDAGPGSHGDFNVAWVPTLVLFTNKGCAAKNLPATCNVTHITLDSEVDAMAAAGTVTLVKLDGTEPPFPASPTGPMVQPDLTFHCSVVPAAVYAQGVPFLG